MLQTVISRKIEERLKLQPLPDCCHLGECTCWFPEAC